MASTTAESKESEELGRPHFCSQGESMISGRLLNPRLQIGKLSKKKFSTEFGKTERMMVGNTCVISHVSLTKLEEPLDVLMGRIQKNTERLSLWWTSVQQTTNSNSLPDLLPTLLPEIIQTIGSWDNICNYIRSTSSTQQKLYKRVNYSHVSQHELRTKVSVQFTTSFQTTFTSKTSWSWKTELWIDLLTCYKSHR